MQAAFFCAVFVWTAFRTELQTGRSASPPNRSAAVASWRRSLFWDVTAQLLGGSIEPPDPPPPWLRACYFHKRFMLSYSSVILVGLVVLLQVARSMDVLGLPIPSFSSSCSSLFFCLFFFFPPLFSFFFSFV